MTIAHSQPHRWHTGHHRAGHLNRSLAIKYAKQFDERSSAIEGCNGIGRHLEIRLFADGERGRRAAQAVRPDAGLRHRPGHH